MEYCPIRNKSTLELCATCDGTISISRCSYLKKLYTISHQDLIDIDLFDTNIEDFSKVKSSPLCSVKCKYLSDKIENVVVGISKKCNLNCYHCFNNDHHNDTLSEKKIYFLALEKVKGHKLNSLLLGSQGEVFSYYEEILKYLKSLTTNDFKIVILQTNATLLDEEKIQELANISKQTGVKYQFFVSMSGITKTTYEETQRGANFEKTLNNIILLLSYFDSKDIRITYVIKRPNITDAPNIKKFFNNIGISQIDITFDLYDFGCKEVYNALLQSDVGQCIYESYKQEKCAGSNKVKKYKLLKNNKASIAKINSIYEDSIKPINKLITNKAKYVNYVEEKYDFDLSIGVTIHGNQKISKSIIDSVKATSQYIEWIVSNDKPTKEFKEYKKYLESLGMNVILSKPGIENNRQNILNKTKGKYLYVIDYDDELIIDGNKLLNFVKDCKADIINLFPKENNKDIDYNYKTESQLFVVTWAQIFKTSFMKLVGGYIQTWNSYHEEFGTNANMLATIYSESIDYKSVNIEDGILYYNHLLNGKSHNSMTKQNVRDYIKFILGIPKNKSIFYKKAFLEFFKMRLNLMNLEDSDYDKIIRALYKVEKKL